MKCYECGFYDEDNKTSCKPRRVGYGLPNEDCGGSKYYMSKEDVKLLRSKKRSCTTCGFSSHSNADNQKFTSCINEREKHDLASETCGCWKSVEEVFNLRPCDVCAFKDMGQCDDCNDVKSSWEEVKRECESCRHSYKATRGVCLKKNCLDKSCWEGLATGGIVGEPMSFTEPLLFNTAKSDDSFGAISYADIEKLMIKDEDSVNKEKTFVEDYLDTLRPYNYSNRFFKAPEIPINKLWHDDFLTKMTERPRVKFKTKITGEWKTMKNTTEMQKEKMKMAGETAAKVSAGRILNTTIKEALGKVSGKIPLDNALATGVIALLANIGIDNTRFKDSKKAQAVLEGMYINAGLEGIDATGIIQLTEGVIESALDKIPGFSEDKPVVITNVVNVNTDSESIDLEELKFSDDEIKDLKNQEENKVTENKTDDDDKFPIM